MPLYPVSLSLPVLVLVSCACSVLVSAKMIVPSGPTTPHWNDTAGNRIEAHSAGLLIENGRYYWYGESKKTDDLSDHGVNCYSASSLAGPWTFEGQILSQKDIVVEGQSGPFVVERPKVLFNNKTNLYVLWFHLDNSGYSFRHAAVAVSPTPTGHFRFVHALQPDGVPSLDMSLYGDWDGQAYFIRSCDNQYAGISRLSPDYLNTTGIISTHSVFEGMAIFRLHNGTYYIICSHLTGWNPNPLMLFRAAGSTLDDPQWVDMGNPTGDPTSFDSQPTYVVENEAADGSKYFVYLADNWVHGGPAGLIDASYVWLPINITADSMSLHWVTEWDPDRPFAPPPPPPPPPPCQQSLYARLSLQPCARATLSWSLSTTSPAPFALKSPGGFCAGPHGTDAYTSMPALALLPCSGDAALQFEYHASSQSIVHAADGLCVDATFCSSELCPGNYLALYACGSPHGNQQFAYNMSTGLLVSLMDASLCLSACTD